MAAISPLTSRACGLGYHSSGESDEALALLGRSREEGATHLAVPATSMWWLDAYQGLTETLIADWVRVPTGSDCTIFAVAGHGPEPRFADSISRIGWRSAEWS